MKFYQIILKLFRPKSRPPKKPPVSVRDSIVNDREWYRPLDSRHQRKKIEKAEPVNDPELKNMAIKWRDIYITCPSMHLVDAMISACQEAYKLGHAKRTEMVIQNALDERSHSTPKPHQ